MGGDDKAADARRLGRDPHALLDCSDRVVAVLAGRARQDFQDVLDKATSLFDGYSQTLPPMPRVPLRRNDKAKVYSRGDFHSTNVGISYGGGQKVKLLHFITGGLLTSTGCYYRRPWRTPWPQNTRI
jgi:hypothetical protein